MILEIRSGAIQMKHLKVTAGRKLVNFPSYNGYEFAYHLKGSEEMATITLINVHIFIEILNNFLIPSIKNCFGDNEIILQNNASFHRAKGIKGICLQKAF